MKLIIFDFDGVLVDTLIPSYEICLEKNENLSPEKYKTFFEGNIHDAFKIKGKLTPDPDFSKKYDECTRELKIPQELKILVQNLEAKYALAIVSSTHTSSIKDILVRGDLANAFGDILGNDINTSKVIKIKMLLEKYKISQDEAVYITDTTGDVNEARECGVKSIAVTWGFHNKETLEKANPAKIIDNPQDLIKTIEEI